MDRLKQTIIIYAGKVINGARQLPFQVRIAVFAALVLAGVLYIYSVSQQSPTTQHTQSISGAHTEASGPDKAPAKDDGTSSQSTTSNQATTQSKAKGSTPAASAPAVIPASVINLSSWKLTLPIGKPGDPDEITQPQLADYTLAPYFQTNADSSGVQFEAPTNGVTTSGSKFARSELREMTDNGQKEASWSTSQGVSILQLRESINHLPTARPQLVAAQIHGPSEYVILVRLNGSDLFVEGSNGKNLGDLDTGYKLGSVFTVQIVAQNGHILVSYNGTQKVDYANDTSGNYFKAGCYTQSNASYGDGASSYGQTTIYSVSVSHT